MVTVKNLKKYFGDVKAVDGLNFTINPGEIVGFLGPNGAGKTTTMRLLTGFLSPDSGSVTIDGIPVERRRERAQMRIGYLPENNPLYKDMLVSELLNLSAELKRIPKDKKRRLLDFVVSAVSIDDVYFRPVRELSKGYKQRVGMAVALLRRPKILIMDEPTEGLDPNQRGEIRALVKKLARNRTIIMSTHVMGEASAVCNRILIINQGKQVADGSPEELSAMAHAQRVMSLDIEGENVEAALRGLAGLEKIRIKDVAGRRVKAQITVKKSAEIQPELSRIARERSWIIWKLAEEEHKLEDIFQKLTKQNR